MATKSRREAILTGPEERLREHLRERNLRLTPERLLVLHGVLSREGHFDAEDLLEHLRRTHQGVSRATLYRTLDHLAEAGLIRKHHFKEGHALFEHVYGRGHHDHMVCDRCRKVIEFVNDQIEELQEVVCRQYGFRLEGHVHQIFGVCSECQAEERDRVASAPNPDNEEREPRAARRPGERPDQRPRQRPSQRADRRREPRPDERRSTSPTGAR